MNSGFYKDLDTNFELACEMTNRNFSHDELIELLKSGNIPEKQMAALRLDSINNQEEADILTSNLTGCDGKIREAVAWKISSLLKSDSNIQKFFNQADVFADASIDINANICRLVIDSVSILKSETYFKTVYLNKILGYTQSAFDELDKFEFRDKKYVINKQLFKLYWCLEALKLFASEMDKDVIIAILNRSCEEKEYTIREKAAQILLLLSDSDFKQLKNNLKSDENYYVRNVFKS